MYDFATDEIVLYLDTHPSDQTALSHFAQYRDLLKQAMDEYEQKYGPLTADGFRGGNMWSWVSEPWPWESGV